MGDIVYKQVYNLLKDKIDSGTFPIGTFLPPEPQLCQMFGVSRTTIRSAVNMLKAEGLLKVMQGYGTEVLDFRATQKLNRVTSFSESMKAKGYDVEAKSIYIDKIFPPENVAAALQNKTEERVVRIQRIQMVNGKPIAIVINYLKEDIAPGIENEAGRFKSLYTHLEKKYGLVITSSVDTISAIAAEFTQAELLGIPVGSPLLTNRRITYSGNRPVEYVEVFSDASRIEYSVNLNGRPDQK